MNNGKEFRQEREPVGITRRHWNHTRLRSRDESRVVTLPPRTSKGSDGLFSETSVACLRRIAENSSVPARMLEQLASHPDPSIREAVADNPNTPMDTLFLLAADESADVRYALAENHNLQLAILSVLVDDENPYVAYRAQKTIERMISGIVCTPSYWNHDEARVAG